MADTTLFMGWIHQCFTPEVKKYFEEDGFEFKVLLITVNPPGHPESTCYEKVKAVSTTSLLLPLDQGIMTFFKVTYPYLIFDHIWSAMDADPNLDTIQHWKSFTFC